MGDIIYTSPVIRCLKNQLDDVKIHYLTKPEFRYLLDKNPYIDQLHLLKPSLSETIKDLKEENFNYIIDLHNSLRSTIIKSRLGIKSSTYKKERIKKWLAINLKINLVKPRHLVDRYLDSTAFLGVFNDNLPIDYFLDDKDEHIDNLLPSQISKDYVAFIIGATHFTKRMPNEKVISLCKKINKPIVLLGGKDVEQNGLEIEKALSGKIINLTGKVSLNQSVMIVKNAKEVVGFDTGLTHIAEAFNKKIISIWGSTVPELLGVQPYKVEKHYEAGVELSCRPCSKFGLAACPRGHFNCMKNIDEQAIADFIEHG